MSKSYSNLFPLIHDLLAPSARLPCLAKVEDMKLGGGRAARARKKCLVREARCIPFRIEFASGDNQNDETCQEIPLKKIIFSKCKIDLE
jgi:hypothetical protein